MLFCIRAWAYRYFSTTYQDEIKTVIHLNKKGIITLLLLFLGLNGCAPDQTILEKIKAKKQLTVVTRNSPTTYYEGPLGYTGMEYDLLTLFAERLGVKLNIKVNNNLAKIISMVEHNKVDLAAAGLTITNQRKKQVRFGSVYQEVSQQVIYRKRSGKKRPRKITDMIGSDIEVVANSSHAENLRALQKEHPDLQWHENEEIDSEEILQHVWSQLVDYTISDSNEVALNQRFMPELSVAFTLGESDKLAWAFPKSIDDSLYNEAISFFSELTRNGTLKQLINRHYGHVREFNYVGTRAYMRDIAKKLPQFRKAFQNAAKKYDLDWRLLAAIGYQESRWNPKAVSPTGVKGIMMLTKNTAKFIGIKNREDIGQSIEGGAKYFGYMLKKIPDRIQEPDRTWMALASYNVGYGHLEDARKITQWRNGDPDKWVDVKENLPLLAKKAWHTKTRHGYARGREPVIYVENIRNYYELLVWSTTSPKAPRKPPPVIKLTSPVL
ncbi:MAG: membrane-bound lytic murein transglycosylase MltF [Gammaproteobacteria bacterium]|nr:MAG: membrane-bound lytic murein transglycosylase MltF [Gammaproteobacteria bacterium]